MALSNVNIDIINGGLGIQPGTGTGIICKVGVSSQGMSNQIYSFTDKDQIKGTIGTGTLANAVADSLMGGAQTIYAVRAEPDIKGTCGSVTALKSGTGSLTVTGDPLDAYDVMVTVTDTGTLNSAAFMYSLNGGAAASKRITIPVNGVYEIGGTGVKLTFAEGSADVENSFIKGDTFAFKTAAPTASIGAINEAIDILLDTNLTYEGIHVCGATSKSMWVALDTRAMEAEKRFRYIYMLAECGYVESGGDVNTWMKDRLDEADTFASDRVGVTGKSPTASQAARSRGISWASLPGASAS